MKKQPIGTKEDVKEFDPENDVEKYDDRGAGIYTRSILFRTSREVCEEIYYSFKNSFKRLFTKA